MPNCSFPESPLIQARAVEADDAAFQEIDIGADDAADREVDSEEDGGVNQEIDIRLDDATDQEPPKHEGVPVPSRFPGTLLTIHLICALGLTLVTTAFTYSSRYRGIEETFSLLPPQPHLALVIIQLLVLLSVRYILQCFLMCCDRLRWILAAGGTPALTFHVLGSSPTGFWALSSLISSNRGKGWRPRSWRLIALFKLLVLHVVLLAAQLVWLVGINPQTAYSKSGKELNWVSRPGFAQGVGEFKLLQGKAFPFSPWRAFDYLSDVTSVRQIEPVNCDTATDLHCASYVLLGYSGLITPNPDQRPHGGGEDAALIKEVPAYIVEFSSGTRPTALTDLSDPRVRCVNYTSKVGSSIKLCMELEPSPLGSRISAGWTFCLQADNCTEVYDFVNGAEAYNNTVFMSTIDIYKSNVSMVIDILNGTILDIYSIGKRSPYAVNRADFFTAFAGPFNYAHIDVAELLASDYDGSFAAVESSLIFLNDLSPEEIKAVNDGFLDSLIWSFTSPLPSESPAVHLRGFLSYALATNSGYYYQSVSPNPVRKTYVLNIKSQSLFTYTGLNIFVWLISVGMLFVKPSRVLPNTTLFTELSFGSMIRGASTFSGTGNMDTKSAIKKLKDVCYYLGVDNGRVVLAETRLSLRSLKRGVDYV